MIHVYVTRKDLEDLSEAVALKGLGEIVKHDVFGGKLETIYLSQRNILTLLHKLYRSTIGEDTSCTIQKNDISNPDYPCSVRAFVTVVDGNIPSPSGSRIIAVPNDKYYSDRDPGAVHSKEEEFLTSIQGI